jgi:hypothetical protein|tara:strand:- start:122 stop:850 length:729 start_codon:yes stop_codon:yes gene_type:complete
MTTYTELVSQIRDYTEVSSDVFTDSIINDFIEHTENKILRDLDLPVFRSYQYATFTASNGFLTLPGGTSITPTEFSIIRSVMIYPAAGTGDRTYLEQRDVTYMNEYWPDRTSTGTPKYYSQWDQNTIYVVPTPSAAFYVEVGLTKLPTRLSSSNTNTWLSDNAPALLLYGCLVEAFKFLKGPADMLQIYTQSYEMALQEVAAQQMGRGRRDEHQSGVIRVPRPSFLPGYSKPGPTGPIEGGQ